MAVEVSRNHTADTLGGGGQKGDQKGRGRDGARGWRWLGLGLGLLESGQQGWHGCCWLALCTFGHH
jgi:hypothetical protein